MTKKFKDTSLPHYHGENWNKAVLPSHAVNWLAGKERSYNIVNPKQKSLANELEILSTEDRWRWPKKEIYFFSDLHADAEAFAASLVATGAVKRTGAGSTDFKLTIKPKQALFIIGGDCFDKGPSNLALLRTIKHLIDLGAKVKLLVGNHDLRMLLAMRAVDNTDCPRNGHFFVRLGNKVLPFFTEIWHEFLAQKDSLKNIPDEAECRRRLHPADNWFVEFSDAAKDTISDLEVKKELSRLKKRQQRFEQACRDNNFSYRQLYAVTRLWHELFLSPKGEFYWFFKKMNLVHKSGSFLFVHAGSDDKACQLISKDGIKQLNKQFKLALKGDPFSLYFGELGNMVRTKYRQVDKALTEDGRKHLHETKIHAIVHGHRNLYHGQRISLRQGIINFECDASVDSHTRENEGLKGAGAAVTIFKPEGKILGISADFPFVKVFEPKACILYLRAILEDY